MTTATTPDAPATFGARWLIVAVMLAAEIMDLLDSTIVNVGGPSLERSLDSDSVGLQWVIGGYALALGTGLIVGGRLGDRFGRRRMFLIGVVSFTLASLLCALAPSLGALITLRLVQGVAAAILLPQGFGLLRESFSGVELARVFGVFGPVFGLGGILGPIIGGGLIQSDLFGLGWRLVFLVNVPIGIAVTAVAWRILPRRIGDRTVAVDLFGAAIVIVSSALLVLPLNQGQSQGWPPWTWISLVTSAAGFFLFTVQQRSAATRGATPLVVPSIFRRPAYTLGLGGIALFFCGLVGSQLVLTLFLQVGQRFSAGEAGLGNLPVAIGTAIGGALSGAVLAGRLGRGVLQVGGAVQLAGAALLWIELGATAPFSIWQIVPGIGLAGIGSGLVVAALFNIILAAVDDHELGSASGVLSAVQSIAGSVGVAVFGSVFFDRIAAAGPPDAYRTVVLIQAALLVVFLALTLLFPRTARPEGDQFEVASAPDPQADPVAS